MLCKNIFEKLLNTELHRFKTGVDGGVDICDNNQNIVIQCKHYCNSSWSNLHSIMKKEKEQNVDLFKKNYFLVTSLGLTKANKLKIANILEKESDISNVYDETEIIDFLIDEKNIDVVKKNHKLWFTSSTVLKILNDALIDNESKTLITDIEDNKKYFVDTTAYYECLKCLVDNDLLLITGSPGSGKTITSMMIILYFLGEDYNIKYSSGNNIEEIIKTIDTTSNIKELIYLDDFLGQHYIDLSSNKVNNINSLLKIVRANKNKKIVMNSRITILNEAKIKSNDFATQMTRDKINLYTIDLEKLTSVDKAKILFNQFFHNKIDKKHFDFIKKDKNYNDIINHRNYNPRIIEKVINILKKNKNQTPEEFYEFLIYSLNNPEFVWDDEFTNRVNMEERVFMNVLYSLTDNTICIEILELCFNSYISKIDNFDTSFNLFEKIITRLQDSLIKVYYDGTNKKIGVLNPSINDYLRKVLSGNVVELKKLLDSSLYIEQVIKIVELNTSVFSSKIDFMNYQTLNVSIKKEMQILKLFNSKNIKSINAKSLIKIIYDNVDRYLTNNQEYYNLNTRYIMQDFILNESLREYYKLNDFFDNPSLMQKITSLSYYRISEVLYKYDSKLSEIIDGESKELLKEQIEETYCDKYMWAIEDKLIDTINDNYLDISAKYEEDFILDEKNNIADIPDDIMEKIRSDIKDKISDKLIEVKNDLNLENVFDNYEIEIDEDDIIESSCFDKNSIIDFYNDDGVKIETPKNEEITVDDIFNQEYLIN